MSNKAEQLESLKTNPISYIQNYYLSQAEQKQVNLAAIVNAADNSLRKHITELFENSATLRINYDVSALLLRKF